MLKNLIAGSIKEMNYCEMFQKVYKMLPYDTDKYIFGN